jgi:hypothetical protein
LYLGRQYISGKKQAKGTNFYVKIVVAKRQAIRRTTYCCCCCWHIQSTSLQKEEIASS